jgi:hypothetical protein
MAVKVKATAMTRITGRFYLDPGDRLTGRYTRPRPCTVLVQWGRGGGPRNVTVFYHDDHSTAVIPFSRRLRKPPAAP